MTTEKRSRGFPGGRYDTDGQYDGRPVRHGRTGSASGGKTGAGSVEDRDRTGRRPGQDRSMPLKIPRLPAARESRTARPEPKKVGKKMPLWVFALILFGVFFCFPKLGSRIMLLCIVLFIAGLLISLVFN